MYLQKLEINGFKSFARKTVFEFDKGVTAIVGPNGSGKSNVAEAIRWVMGEQSAKSLRSKKGTDVIFFGSDKASRLGLAEVSLSFDNSEGDAPLDFSEITITRKIHRDGRGEYLINNKTSRLQDVLLLLAQINLSSKTYSVISQGMVDMILTISPAERKDFFEEASGVKPLQIKKNEALRKLTASQENIQTIEIQLAEIIPRLRSLTRQVKRLNEREEMDKRLRKLQYHYFGEMLYSLVSEQESLNKKEYEQSRKVGELEAIAERQQKQMYELTRESTRSAEFSVLQKQYQEILNKRAKLKEQELEIRGNIVQASRANEKTSVPVSEVRIAHDRWKEHRDNLRGLLDSIKNITEVSELDAWRNEYEKCLQKSDTIFMPLESYLENKEVTTDQEKELNDVREKISQLDEKLKKVQDEITSLSKREKEEKGKIWETQNELQKTQQQLSAINNELSNIRISVARVETRKADIENEIAGDVGEEFLEKVRQWRPGDTSEVSDTETVKNEIQKLKHQLELIGGIDPEVHSEYTETKERHDFLGSQLSDLHKSIDQLMSVIQNLDETITNKFDESFKKINQRFQSFFKILFEGGRAELKFVKKGNQNSETAGEETGNITQDKTQTAKNGLSANTQNNKDEIVGVDITAVPPGKKLSTVTALSGGERALTSIALIAAIIANNPAPFVVLDEVDAALDEANSVRFSKIVSELSKQTQFIIITHNRATMEQAQILYGVTMSDSGISKLLSMKIEAASKFANR